MGGKRELGEMAVSAVHVAGLAWQLCAEVSTRRRSAWGAACSYCGDVCSRKIRGIRKPKKKCWAMQA